MKCKNMKVKIGNIPYCKIKKKEINYRLDCINCKYYEFDKKYVNYSKPNRKPDFFNRKPDNFKKSLKIDQNRLKSKSYKLAKLERDRFSILTTDLEHCYICGEKKDNLHEVYFGNNRINSMKYGCVLPLCYKHHIQIHNDIKLDIYYKILMQKKFIEVYPELSFIDIFKINYK